MLANPRLKKPPPGLYRTRDYAAHRSGATLVLCPSHLVLQWKKEIEDSTPLVVVTICTSTDWKRTSYGAVRDADVVIVSHSFLMGGTYSYAIENRETCHLVEAVQRSRRRAAEPKGKYLFETNPILQKIDWHRVVVDEGHEVLCDSKFIRVRVALNGRLERVKVSLV